MSSLMSVCNCWLDQSLNHYISLIHFNCVVHCSAVLLSLCFLSITSSCHVFYLLLQNHFILISIVICSHPPVINSYFEMPSFYSGVVYRIFTIQYNILLSFIPVVFKIVFFSNPVICNVSCFMSVQMIILNLIIYLSTKCSWAVSNF